jgi:probable DNA metabolism protein
MRALSFDGTFADWKRVARRALTESWPPHDLRWANARAGQVEFDLALAEVAAPYGLESQPAAPVRVPRAFLALAEEAACHSDPTRWDLLYRLLWRLGHGEPHLLEVTVDADVTALRGLAKAVHRDIHKMHAFVRFREIATAAGSWFVAWFEPQHHIVEAAAPFFVKRFAAMRWSILTPERCAHWDGRALTFAAGTTRDAAPAEDAAEDLWRAYYASIFNPARLKVGTMASQMPRHYWANLPEARLIPELIASAQPRMDAMVETSEQRRERASDFTPTTVPATRDLSVLRSAAATCRSCPLWRNASCTVFGEGREGARVVVVGEQPGDQEDRAGRPFVGPAGQLFDRALQAAGIDRAMLYVTNAVKHFKWEPRGKRRLHQKPNAREIAACRPWVEAELRAIQPDAIVCLGVTAAQSILEAPLRVGEERGRWHATAFGAPALITVHPSSLLRLPPGEDPVAAFDHFVADLRRLSERVKTVGASPGSV